MNAEPAAFSGEAASVAAGSPEVRLDRAIVRVRRVWKTYHSGRFRTLPAVEALRGVSLEAYPGEVFGLLGPNGAGKTTLIKILLGIIRPTAGGGELFGRPLGDSVARMRVGYLPESLRVDRHHTARSALRYYGRLSRLDRRTIDLRSDELLELVGLRDRARESVRRFSKGMYQRLGLAQALMHDPDLLVLDEPTDGLDPVGRHEVRRVIERLRDLGKTVFLNSHILQEVELVCSRLAVMAGGQIRAIGTLAEITERKSPRFEFILDGGDHPPLSGVLETVLERVEGLQWSVDELPAVRDVRVLLSVDPNIEPMTDRSGDRTRGQRLVDQVVDLLRGQGISIRRLRPVEETLEQAFIRLTATEVSSTPDPETPGAGTPSDVFDPGASGAPSGPLPKHESSESLSTENR